MRLDKSRRKSVDSSSSSSSDSSDPHKKGTRKEERKGKREQSKKEKEQRKEERRREKEARKQQRNDHKAGKSSHSDASFPVSYQMTQGGQFHIGGVGYPHSSHPGQPDPPPYVPQHPIPPPSGYRSPLTTQTPFPQDPRQTGPPAFIDADGVSPIFIGSALMDRSVHPCKIGPHLNPFASVPYGGGEHGHHGRYDLLPFRHDQMEWVRTSSGRIPSGRRPIEGGYEEDGRKLYHAVAVVHGVKVPGKTGEHLVGARVPFGGVEHEILDDYEILCWRH